MRTVSIVFVLLTYRNEKDLIDFLNSAREKVEDYVAVVVNSYYDDESLEKIKKVAEEYECHFINIENKGYGYGNNQGVLYANAHFDYQYLIVSNPDIIIKNYSKDFLQGMEKAVVAPRIENAKGNMQNPMVWKKSEVAEALVYTGLKNDNKLLFYMGMGINKVIRILFLLTHRKDQVAQVYQAHGSFIIFSKYVLAQIGLPFDEQIFLFAEEGDLAAVLNKKGLPIYYVPSIVLFHKEDGSMQFREDLNQRLVSANVYVYEKYHKKD